MDNTFDRLFYGEGELIGGVDESGIIDIAGPLVAACVILPRIDPQKDSLKIFEVDDCKKIDSKWHKSHAEVIWETAIAIGIGEVTPAEFDCLKRQDAQSLAHMRAVMSCRSTINKRPMRPDFLIVDGDNPVPINIKQALVRHADQASLCVASASIIAKMWRDSFMAKLHEKYPHYDWIHNKGHPSDSHLQGLDRHGLVPGVHRIKKWPFSSHKDTPEDFIKWQQRRRQWRRLTLENLCKELDQDNWTHSPELSTHSVCSSPAARRGRRRGRGGRNSKRQQGASQPTPVDAPC